MIWHGDTIYEQRRSQFAAQVQIAGDGLSEQMKSTVGVDGPPRSLPGEPPHTDTTDLQQSIGSTLDESDPDRPRAIVGSGIEYGIYLELGTGARASDPTKTKHHGTVHQIAGMAPRPWCLSTLKNGKQLIRLNILGK